MLEPEHGCGGWGGGVNYFVSFVNEVISKSLLSLYTPPPHPSPLEGGSSS